MKIYCFSTKFKIVGAARLKMTNLTSDEINYLIYRYLAESGFSHSSFSFANESGILKSDIKGSQVSPGFLIRILQKGLLYMSLEAHVSPEGNIVKCLAPFSLLGPHECQIYTDPNDIMELEDSETQIQESVQPKEQIQDAISLSTPHNNTLTAKSAHTPIQQVQQQMQQVQQQVQQQEENTHIEKDSMDMDSGAITQDKTDSISYYGHTAEVFTCAWNRNDEWIATG